MSGGYLNKIKSKICAPAVRKCAQFTVSADISSGDTQAGATETVHDFIM